MLGRGGDRTATTADGSVTPGTVLRWPHPQHARSALTTKSMELLTCSAYGCPGCDYRHFLRGSDGAELTEVPGEGVFTAAQLSTIGRAAQATGAMGTGA